MARHTMKFWRVFAWDSIGPGVQPFSACIVTASSRQAAKDRAIAHEIETHHPYDGHELCPWTGGAGHHMTASVLRN